MVDRPRIGRLDLFPSTKVNNMLLKYCANVFFLNRKIDIFQLLTTNKWVLKNLVYFLY